MSLYRQGLRLVCQDAVAMVGGPERQIMGWLMCRPKRLDCNEARCIEKTNVILGQRLH